MGWKEVKRKKRKKSEGCEHLKCGQNVIWHSYDDRKLEIWKITTLNENEWRSLWYCTVPVPTHRPAYPMRCMLMDTHLPEAAAQGCSFLPSQQSSLKPTCWHALTRWRGSAFASSGLDIRLGLFCDWERWQSMLAAEVKAAHKFTHDLLQKYMVFCFSRQQTVGKHSWWDMSLTFKRLWEFEKVIVPLTQSVLNILVVKIKILNKTIVKGSRNVGTVSHTKSKMCFPGKQICSEEDLGPRDWSTKS